MLGLWEEGAGTAFTQWQVQGLPEVRVLFVGNRAIGHDALKLLYQRTEVVGVFASGEVWDLGNELGLNTCCPDDLTNDLVTLTVKRMNPDILISVSYPKIIPQNILRLLPCVNLHGSLLPSHRGRFCAVWAILEGQAVTGVTLHYMDVGIDTGPIIDQTEILIYPDDTAYTLYQRQCGIGLELLEKTLEKPFPWKSYTQPYRGRYYHEFKDRQIDWAGDVEHLVRACYFPPYPPAYTDFHGLPRNVYKVRSIFSGRVTDRAIGRVVGFFAGNPIIQGKELDYLLVESDLNSLKLGDHLG